MDIITNNWKSNIFGQLKEHNRIQNGYDPIVEQCRKIFIGFRDYSYRWIDNKILDNNAILQVQCTKLEKDVNQLRLTNAGLEKASEAR